MKKILLLLFIIPFLSMAQNVGIGTITPAEKLEVKSALRSTVKISSNNFIDTTELYLSNRNGSNQGTDFSIKSIREQGLFFSSFSDLPGNVSDNSLVIRPNGNLGVNNPVPNERLDVNGNINVTGTIKANGTDGAANQVLMKNSTGNLAWGDVCEFKNMATFRIAGAGSWTVPPATTRVMVEAWGSGAGGSAYAGGGGGGYVRGIFTVTPGFIINFSIGDGGIGAQANPTDGQSTTVSMGVTTIIGDGGVAPIFTPATLSITTGDGGTFGSTSASFFNYTGAIGQQGLVGLNTFIQSGTSTFLEIVQGADGGDGANTINTEAKGAYYAHNVTANTKIRSQFLGVARAPGGGGPGGYVITSATIFGNGSSGADGMVIIHY